MGAGLREPRLVKVRAGGRGAGWAVGARGVLTARHVIAPFLSRAVDYCLAVPDPRPGAVSYNCVCVWDDSVRDLALLAVEENETTNWVAAVGGGNGPALAEPGTGVLDAEAIGYPDATVENDVPHPEQAPGQLLPGGGAVYGEMPFDIDSSVPDGNRAWEGMSGAAVRDSATQRLVGVVVRADSDQQRRRLYVRALPDPAFDASFARALIELGVPPVLEAATAPAVRRLLAVWDKAAPFQRGK